MKPLIAKPSRVTLIAYAVFAVTGTVIWLASISMDSDRAIWLILLALPLSVISIVFSLILAFRTWRSRFGLVADVLDGKARDVEIDPSDRMLH